MAQANDDYKKFINTLKILNKETIPIIISETINNLASVAHVASIKNVRSRFVLRTKYTENSLRYYKANPKSDINKINAISGSISDYMDEQDQGGYRVPKIGAHVAVPTLAARGGDRSKRKIKRYYLGQELEKHPKLFIGKPKGMGKNAGRVSGIYERHSDNKRIRMIHEIDKSKIQIKPTRWHVDAMRKYKFSEFMAEFIRQAKIYLK